MRVLILLLFQLNLIYAQDGVNHKKCVVKLPANIYESASLNSKVVATLMKGDTVLLLDEKSVVFYKIKYQEKEAYIWYSDIEIQNNNKNSIAGTPPNKTSGQNTNSNTTKSKSNPPAYPSTKPKSSSGYSSKDCSAVQCSGRTKKGSRCGNRTTNCSGRCHLH